jgi:alpha-galactosidase
LAAVKDLPPNGLAKTPPMGWNSWNKFRTKIDDKTVREIADAIVSSGMKDVGYQYVNIDDGWEWKRDEAGKNPAQSQLPRHEGPRSLCAFEGIEAGDLFVAGPDNVWRIRRQLRARRAGCEELCGMGNRLPEV